MLYIWFSAIALSVDFFYLNASLLSPFPLSSHVHLSCFVAIGVNLLQRWAN